MRGIFVATILLSLTAFPGICLGYLCVIGQQPDPHNDFEMSWALPYTKEERCTCTLVIFGGMNTVPPPGAEDHFYTDLDPLLFVNNHDLNSLLDLLECLDEVCLSNPCQNGGTCVDESGTYTCSCWKGYSGKQCEIETDECEPGPCQNGGTCIDNSGSFSCSCVEGYDGDVCDEDNASPVYSNTPTTMTVNTDPGQPTAVVTWTEPTVTDNSGPYTVTSTHSPGSSFDRGSTTVTYTAVDESGSETTYSFDVTVTVNYACVTNTCENGGVCVIDASTETVSCICQTGYGGPRCEIDVESVFITVHNNKQLRAENSPFYQCYQTKGETTPRTYGRYVNTRDDTSQYQTPTPKAHTVEINAQNIEIPPNNHNGFGIFYCRGTQPNKTTTTVLTILLRGGGAKVYPKGGLFTKTVNKGEVGATLKVKDVNGDDCKESEIRWMFNGTEGIVNPSFTYTISDPVAASNEGVYEAYYDGKRDEQKHAIMRLIVRDCAASRWGPPSCSGICDKCYNGGVCDDKSGKCICPPGFMGDNCLTACGENKFGKNCEFICTRDLTHGACQGWEVCLPDPYGCTCNTGFYTLDCEDACKQNTFGASCTQDCHCASGECHRYTGACEGANITCLEGWTGYNCQIPDVCENGYYSPNCTEKCHCLNDAACVKITGECPDRQCAPGFKVYSGSVNCQN